MARNVDLSSIVLDTQYILEKYKLVLSHFPDCKIQKVFDGFVSKQPVFVSKSVNQNYTTLGFVSDPRRLFVVPHCKLDFEYNGKKEVITVHSSPKRTPLAKIGLKWSHTKKQYDKDENGKYIRKIVFSRVAINLKNNNFDDKMLSECQAHIMTFIKEHPGHQIDGKHLDPRLKKLLAFL